MEILNALNDIFGCDVGETVWECINPYKVAYNEMLEDMIHSILAKKGAYVAFELYAVHGHYGSVQYMEDNMVIPGCFEKFDTKLEKRMYIVKCLNAFNDCTHHHQMRLLTSGSNPIANEYL